MNVQAGPNRQQRRRAAQKSKRQTALPDSFSMSNGMAAIAADIQASNGDSPAEAAKPAARAHKAGAKYERMRVQLVEQIGGLGFLMSLAPRTQADGQAVIARTIPLSDKLVACAKENEWFYEALNTVLNATVWVQLAGEVVTIAALIAANHGLMMPGIGTMAPPQVPPDMFDGGLDENGALPPGMTPEQWFAMKAAGNGN